MNDLLACPFCGGPAERGDVPADIEDENAGGSYIQCTKCSASTATWAIRAGIVLLVVIGWGLWHG